MGRGCSLTYGKIIMVSETEDMTAMIANLAKILDKHGYPEQERKATPAQQDIAKKEFEAALEKTKKERDWNSNSIPDSGSKPFK